MSGPFKVGEVLVGVGFVVDIECNGLECVVERNYGLAPTHYIETGEDIGSHFVYLVRWVNGNTDNVCQPNLRRKQPPSGELSILRMFDLTAPAPREVEAA